MSVQILQICGEYCANITKLTSQVKKHTDKTEKLNKCKYSGKHSKHVF